MEQKTDKKGQLSRKKQAFCVEYIRDHDGVKAMVRVGYSRSTALGRASQFLKEPEVAKYIKELESTVKDTAIADYEEVCRFLTRVIRTDVTDVKEEDKDLIQEKSVTETLHGGSTKIKLPSKLEAIKILIEIRPDIRKYVEQEKDNVININIIDVSEKQYKRESENESNQNAKETGK